MQSVQQIRSALSLVAEGLRMLEVMGEQYHLSPGPQPPMAEWPRIMFHALSAPNGRMVQSEWELADLGEGWWPTLEEAQLHEGENAQWRGRGGVERGRRVALRAADITALDSTALADGRLEALAALVAAGATTEDFIAGRYLRDEETLLAFRQRVEQLRGAKVYE
jgi:hypothetical protein